MNELPFVELCAGSAAIMLQLNGQTPPVSYAGNKRGYANTIIETFGITNNKKRKYVLVEPGYWGTTWEVLNDSEKKHKVAERIETLSLEEPKIIWSNAKKDMKAGDSDIIRCAAHLLTVAGTHGGFEKGGFKGKHKRRPNVDGFIPNRNSIAERIKKLQLPEELVVYHQNAQDTVPFKSYCYIDPPYMNTIGYEYTLTRNDVVDLGKKWAKIGAFVMISEGEPITELVKCGWSVKDITKEREGQFRKNSVSKNEWITFNF